MEQSERQELNAGQAAAVGITDGPVLVVAGAGTGKTRVIVERILRLIADGVKPENILGLTFTEKAAGEMLDRVADASLGAALDTTIATYNGFGSSLLERYGHEWGLGVPRLLGDTGQLVFLREHFDELELDYFAPISTPDGQLDRLCEYVSQLKQQLISPEAYERYAAQLPAADEADALEKKKHQELARFYRTYLALCRTNQVIDYDDQLYLTLELLQARPNVLRELQARYHYVLVDEFQDTNPMQSALVDLLVGSKQNLMVVGDDDQSIYGWRGATLANILDFTKRYPTAKDITLIENYRSTQSILDSAYRLIQHNNPERLEVINHLDKRLHAQTDDGPAPVTKHFYTLEAELTWLADDIAKRLQNGQEPSSIAVLARRSQTVTRVHETLELHNIPHAMAGLSNDIYDQPAVRQLIEVLKAVGDPLDDMALFHALSGPVFAIPAAELSAVSARAKREYLRLDEAVAAAGNQALQTSCQTIASWREMSSSVSVGDLAYQIITDSGWKQQLYEQSLQDPAMEVPAQAVSKFFTTLKEFERIAGVPSVQNYLASLPVLQASGSEFTDATLDISDSLVNVLSVHRAKGLEWETVYIVDCTEGSFPLHARGGSLQIPTELKTVQSRADEHLAEERRLMYVAVTRARRELVLTYANRHGDGAPRRPSRFLAELFETLPTDVEPEAEQSSLELFAPHRIPASAPLPANMYENGMFTLSVSHVACWLDCPLDFYYKYVLGIPLPPDPSRGYGTAIHGAIQRIFDGRRQGSVPTLEALTEQIQAALPRAGYASPHSRERAHAQALRSIEHIYERFTRESLPIEDELPFSVHIPDLPLKLVGRMDAIYQLDEGIEIRDFKTSTSVTTPEQAKARTTNSKQLTLYALAWKLLHGEMPAKLTLDFVETGQIQSVRKQAKSLDTMQRKLADMISHLQAGEYPPGKDHTYCKHP